eukprot:COSAG06_NODE_6964_length_2694_cov_3.747206_5_plen_54_part_00
MLTAVPACTYVMMCADTVEWEIVGLGASPKAENSWTKGILRELDGTIVAESLT